MTKIQIDLEDEQNYKLGVLKAKQRMKSKEEAIKYVIDKYFTEEI